MFLSKELRPKCLVNLEKWSQIGGGTSEMSTMKCRPKTPPKPSENVQKMVQRCHKLETLDLNN